MRDAAMFPVYASGGLFGLYLFFKVVSEVDTQPPSLPPSLPQFLPKEYVNMTLSVLFLLLGISAVTRALRSASQLPLTLPVIDLVTIQLSSGGPAHACCLEAVVHSLPPPADSPGLWQRAR